MGTSKNHKNSVKANQIGRIASIFPGSGILCANIKAFKASDFRHFQRTTEKGHTYPRVGFGCSNVA